jgi:hypothetical protein
MSWNNGGLRTLALAASVVISLTARMASAAEGSRVTPEGIQLGQMLDSMQVEQLWLPGGRVAWKTGQPLGDSVVDSKPHTHCSAFVAAFCTRLNIYILSPPEHSTVMLANAQYDWLRGEGRNRGWKPVSDPVEAQALSNQGLVVVATYKESRRKPGHIAIVRPSNKSIAAIESEGPQITQAGRTNYRSTSLALGFRNHPAAWGDQRVRFFCHDVSGN